jgi:2,4-dienoyl-CoA reductase-like NADH-dependent reductase (Old Yellow Enzyme family)
MSKLFEPLTLRCGQTLPSRVALAPLTNLQSHDDGTLGAPELAWLERRARGGFAWVSTCAAYVCEEGKAWRGQLGIATDAHLEGLTRIASALRTAGALPVVQLHHAGKLASLAPGAKLAPTADAAANVHAATSSDLSRVADCFVEAALRAERAGFAGVEVHGANGYLFTQFLAPADNQREDAYGGSIENRARLLRDTVRAVRAAVSPRFAVGVRLTPVDTFAQRGIVLDDTLAVVRGLAADGVDFVHLSLRDASGPPPFEPERGPVARALREALPSDVALLAAGGLWTLADVERAFAVGVDVAVLGKAAIGNPDWPHLARQPGFEPSRPPWSAAQLTSLDVSEAFVTYLRRFDGLVTDGAPAR